MSETTEEFEIDFDAELSIEDLLNYAKLFSGLEAEDEACLKNIAPLVTPHLVEITDSFYAHLNNIPQAASFIKGRVEKLKITHLNWLPVYSLEILILTLSLPCTKQAIRM